MEWSGSERDGEDKCARQRPWEPFSGTARNAGPSRQRHHWPRRFDRAAVDQTALRLANGPSAPDSDRRAVDREKREVGEVGLGAQ